MTIIQTIITALSAGAVVALEATAGQVIKDAYTALKGYLQTNYTGLHLKELETDPNSPAWRAVLQEELTKANAAADTALLAQVQTLLDAVASQPSSSAVVGVDLADIRSAALKLTDVIAEGSGAVTGVKIQGATIEGALEISGVRASQGAATINTDGGSYIAGNVHTEGGDFVGRDKQG